uniref:Uncharacterized protein n=1 Tax=Panagrolaimus superbus TaxID=310955 RepID=A0A914YG98_9BILA
MDGIASQTGLTTLDRMPWTFRHQYAGYHQPYYTLYNNGANRFTIDVLTVKVRFKRYSNVAKALILF